MRNFQPAINVESQYRLVPPVSSGRSIHVVEDFRSPNELKGSTGFEVEKINPARGLVTVKLPRVLNREFPDVIGDAKGPVVDNESRTPGLPPRCEASTPRSE